MSDDYRTRLDIITEQFKQRQEKAFEELHNKAAKKNVTIVRTPSGFALAPVRDDAVIEPDDFSKLSEKKRKEIKTNIAALEGDLQTLLRML